MQRTTQELHILVGEDKCPLTLTDSAVEAVQGEAAGRLQEAVEEIGKLWNDQVAGFEEATLEELLTLRVILRTASEACDVLIECRPLDEIEAEDDD